EVGTGQGPAAGRPCRPPGRRTASRAPVEAPRLPDGRLVAARLCLGLGGPAGRAGGIPSGRATVSDKARRQPPMTAGHPAPRAITLRRTIPARRGEVFRAWTDPAELKRWWARPGFTVVDAQVDLRVGGGFRIDTRPDVGERVFGVWRLSRGAPS